MPKLFKLSLLAISFLFLLSNTTYAVDESITFTTYYPSPTGSYHELRSARMAIGAGYIDPTTHSWDGASPTITNADLVVEGNVGIGTPTPEKRLHVYDPSSANTVTPAEFFSDLKNDGYWNHILVGRANSDGNSAVFGYRYDTTPGDEGAFITIWGDPISSLFIKNGGNVGIGTTTPGNALDVSNANYPALSVHRQANGTNYGSGITFDLNNASNARKTYALMYGGITTNTAGAEDGFIQFQTITAGTLTDKFRITKDGSVGIMTTNPKQTLSVIGNGVFGAEIDPSSYSKGLSVVSNSGTPVSLLIWQSGIGSGHIGVKTNDSNFYIVNSYTTGNLADSPGIAIDTKGNVGIGTPSPGGGTGSSILSLYNTSAVPTALTNAVHIYASGGRGYCMDSLGNLTLTTPHDPVTGEWIFYSENVKTGKVVRINMEQLVKAVEEATGKKFMTETYEGKQLGANRDTPQANR